MAIKVEPLVDDGAAILESTKDIEEREKAKKTTIKSITDLRRASAWQLHRWPIEKNVTWSRTKIHLPRSYLGRDGEDVLVVHAASDLNQFVYNHYLNEIDSESARSGVNFVDVDNIVPKRHELLGPDPRVAGYLVDMDGEIHIKWWDGFLSDQWMDKQKWKIAVLWDGEKWVEKVD